MEYYDMLYKLILDENNYLVSFMHTETEEDTTELNPLEMDLNNLDCYHLVDDEVILDEEKIKAKTDKKAKAEQIAELKQELASTDYQIIKCSECQLLGQPMPYDVAELHAQRQAIRDEINALES